MPAVIVTRADCDVPPTFVPHSCQPPIATGALDLFLSSMTSSFPPAGPRVMIFEITTVVDGSACAAGAASAPPSRTNATVAAGRRIFTVQESFPRGNPRDGRNRIAARGRGVTVP